MEIDVLTHKEVYENKKLVQRLKKLTNPPEIGSGMLFVLSKKLSGIFVIATEPVTKKVVGWLYACEGWSDDKLQISIFVQPKYRRKNIATKLINAVKNNSNGKTLVADPWSQPGKLFFRKNGILHENWKWRLED